jgi:amino acid transporter
VLAAKVAADGALPQVFGLRGDRQVYRTSIIVLTVLSAALLLASAGQVNVLVPLFAIGVFVGFTLCQVGMLRQWWRDRGPGWRPRAALNGFGAVLTAVAAVVLTVEKFTEGAWLVALVIPLMVAGFQTVRRAYDRIGRVLEVDARPQRPRVEASVVVVPIVGITRLAEEPLGGALPRRPRRRAARRARGRGRRPRSGRRPAAALGGLAA